ncbi:MAG: NADH-quinone oxidoreductase subunit K [Anaerolineae bacterium]|nr:NADH-quinone oxidoreductase subunit K [Anaerolineae bacterium]
MSDVEILLVGGFMLAGVGLYGLLVIRNLIKVVVAMQIMVKGVLLALAAAAETSGQINLGQSMILTVIVADTVVAVIGLALAVQVRRVKGTLDVRELSELRG